MDRFDEMRGKNKKIKLQEKNATPTTIDKKVVADEEYDGLSSVTVKGDTNLISGNIKKDISIFGVTGTLDDEIKLQNKSVTPTAGGTTVTPDDGYDGLSSVGVNGDTNLIAENIKKDVSIFGVTGTLETDSSSGDGGSGSGSGGTSGSDGILPFPVTAFVVGQTRPQEGNITLKVHVPESATSVDVLVKNEGIPADVNDYNQKFTIDYGDTDTDIFLEPKNDGGYDNQYGFWLLSKNGNGRQTALGKYNTKLIDFIYSKQVITVTSSIGHSTTLTNLIPVNDCIFLSSGSDSYKGIYLLNKSTKTITKLSSSGYNIKKVEYLGSGYYLLCHSDDYHAYSSTNGYIYSERDGTLKTLNDYVTNGSSQYYDLNNFIYKGQYVVFGGTNGICVWNKESSSLSNAWVTGYSMVETDSGVFIQGGGTLKRLSGGSWQNCTYQLIDEEATGQNDPVIYKDPVTYEGNIVEDTFGRIYGLTSSSSYHTLLYVGGNNFVEIKDSEIPYFFQNNFKMGEYLYYLQRGKLCRYTENGIKLVRAIEGSSASLSGYEAVGFGNGYIIKKIDNKDWAFFYRSYYEMGILVESITPIGAPDATGTYIAYCHYIAEDGTERIYYSGSTTKKICYLYLSSESEVSYETVADDKYVIEIQQVGDLLFAKGDTSSKAIYSIGIDDNTLTQLGTYKYYRNSTQMTQVDFIKNGDLVYIVQHYKNQFSSSYVGDTLIYDIATGTVTTSTDKKGGIRLDWGYYYQPTEGKVYSYKGDDIITTTLTSATSSSTDVCAGYVTTSAMTFVYMA